jgi:hypothetical protein
LNVPPANQHRSTITLPPQRIDPGIGYGERLNIAFKTYTYTGSEPGFAESDLDEYDKTAAELAFTRSLTTVRKGFRIENDIEAVRDHHTAALNDPDTTPQTRATAHVLHAPTLTGGVGADDIAAFYADFFAPLPPRGDGNGTGNGNGTTQLRLLSRTVGTDRVVDELYLGVDHTREMPWLLPGTPPTHRRVEIVIVSVFHVRGDKVESEHVYWDQASVLAQTGLLDPKLVPEGMRRKGMERLPIVGAEAARAIKRGSSGKVNDLIPDW